jgi:hypothetical protein
MAMRHQIRKPNTFSDRRRDSDSYQGPCPEKYTSLGNAVLDVLLVLRIAQEIEPNPNEMLFWYQNTKINELDSLTAEQLVHDGRAAEVIEFLRSIRSAVRH